MAGGSGTRFWPESRKKRPKQLLQIISDKTMVRATAERILPEISFDRIMVVTTEVYAEEIKRELPEVSHNMIVAEPQGRNTAPCIGLAAYKIAKQDPDAVLIILPADHLIANEEAFLKALRAAYQAASSNDYLITFGIVPSCPETGYGYIELGREISGIGSERLFHVKSFVEKPDLVTAKRYLAGGNYLWNSGMFVWKAATVMEALKRFKPESYEGLKKIQDAWGTDRQQAVLAEVYPTLPKTSVDYALMEPASKAKDRQLSVCTVLMDLKWLDVGSWPSFGETINADAQKNRTAGGAHGGKAVIANSTGNLIVNPVAGHTVALLGCKDLIVVHTPDATLVMPRERAEELKELHGKVEDGLK